MDIRHRLFPIFPISIKNYGVGVALVTLALFAALTLYALYKVDMLNGEFKKNNSTIAREELQKALGKSITLTGNMANSYAQWDETIQQLNNPTYYNYWRSNRAREATFNSDYFQALELYDKNGQPLSSDNRFTLLPVIDDSKLGALFGVVNDMSILYYVSHIGLNESGAKPIGYVVVAVDFKRVLKDAQKFKQLDYASLDITLANNSIVLANDFSGYIKYNTVTNSEYETLQVLMSDTLLQFAVLGVLSVLGSLYIIFVLLGKPLALLSLHIDALSEGKHDALDDGCSGFFLVMEFNKLRQSLNEYIRQLERLEDMASGNMDEIINPEAEIEVGGLMRSFNKIALQLKETMIEKDQVSLQLMHQAEDLRKASAQSLEANKAKSNFLANMSHEIRTPLTAIIGFAEASIEKDQSIDERMYAMQTIVSSGYHLLQLINDILDLSKIEANKLDIELMSISPFQIVMEVKSLLKQQALDKGIDFDVHYILPLPIHISSDAIRIKQVILNLCNNAIKFTQTGHVYLNMSSDLVEQTVIFEVIDTGIGLSEQQVKKLFKPFTQADTSTTRKYGGTGLGLSLSKKLVEMLGGCISVESQLNVGSKFTATFATGKLSSEDYVRHESEIPIEFSRPEPTATIRLLQGHVLIADDVLENQKLISLYLKKWGITSTAVGDGQSAVEQVKQVDYDFVLMDMQMPIMDGLTATSKIRSEGNNIPIAALTANAFQQDKERCLSSGIDYYLVKPINRKKLYETLAIHLPYKDANTEEITPIVSSLNDDPLEFDDLIQKYIQSLPETISQLEKELGQEDWSKLKILLHGVCGTSGNMGYPEVASVAKNMQSKIDNREYSKLTLKLIELKLLHRRIRIGFDEEQIKSKRA